jgi:solute carrier family 25 (mitochondrial folate transporter), member 32
MEVDRNTSAKMGGIVRIAKQVYADEKSLLSFYRGLSPNMIGNAASWGFYFMWYTPKPPINKRMLVLRVFEVR